MKVIEINTFQEYINFINDNNHIILNVSAKWCKPCNEIVSHKIIEIIDFIDNNIGNIDNFEINDDF